jgi:hypothetical protein
MIDRALGLSKNRRGSPLIDVTLGYADLARCVGHGICGPSPDESESHRAPFSQPRAMPPSDLTLMRRIDELHLATRSRAVACCAICWPRRPTASGRRHMTTLMKTMRIEALYRRSGISHRHAAHP